MSESSTYPRGFDSREIRKHFPILSQSARGGSPLVYLDNAATTHKPAAVIAAIGEYYTKSNSNVHRGFHYLAEKSTLAYEEVRGKIRLFINAPAERNIVFTRGATESVNLAASAWGDSNISEGDEILVSEMEHHSNLVPWQMLAERRGAKLRVFAMDEAGEIIMESLADSLGERARLVAVTHVSNVLGTINPIKEIAKLTHAAGARLFVDGAQGAPNMPVDVQDLGCDFYAFSGHKMCAPTGIGVLFANDAVMNEMGPWMGGGEMISRVTYQSSTWAEPPLKFEAGTPNIEGAIGLGAALDFLSRIGMDAIESYQAELTAKARAALSEIPGLRIHGRAARLSGSISFEMEGIHPHDIAHLADRRGVAIRAGHLCAQPLMRKLGVGSLSRASLYFYNTENEIAALVKALHKVREVFGRGH